MTVSNNSKDSVSIRRRLKKCAKNTCSVKAVKKRVPILQWLPNYSSAFLIQDIIAGITVGLTAIPQGIAYAVVAGLSPEYGLYASLTSGFVYVVFGSCKDVTVGPTAILATMIAKYVSDYSPDFAILAAFLSGLLIFLMGVLQLGILVEFISQPVITGFTIAAALQIAASQLKSMFGLSGSSGNTFVESVTNVVHNIKTAKLWDSILSVSTIIMLLLLQKLGKNCNRTDGTVKQIRWFVSLSRNAVVVIIGIIIAYILKVTTETEPLVLIGEIGNGLPTIQLPPFSSVVGNKTLNFIDMVQNLGPTFVFLPFVAVLESIAIAKAFSGGKPVDATQEMIALGLCNIIGSLALSMPITGSFTRTALNHASGVQTPAGGITKCLLLIFALGLMTSTFYYIPKASLAGLIMTAMFAMIDYAMFGRLWKTSKKELVLLMITIIVCLASGLEYGIIAGVLVDVVILLYNTSRPVLKVNAMRNDTGELIVVPLSDNVSYCTAEHVRRAVIRASKQASADTLIVIDGTNLRSMDSTVASNLISLAKELDRKNLRILFLNFISDLKNMCVTIDSKYSDRFMTALNAMNLVNTLPMNV